MPRREAIDISDVPPTPITHLSETETLMGDSVSKFANEVILPKAREMDEAEAMDPAIVEQLFEQGLMGIEIPEEYGGSGMNFTSAIIAIEELARVDPSVSVLCDVHNTLVNTAILKWGSEKLKKEWLPKLATNTVGSFCLSEPVSGSDAFALATKATRTDTGYKISGSKMWITNSVEANFFIVFANLDPSKKYKGITAFIVEKGTPGFAIAKKEKKLGIKASSTCVITFDDVEIPRENLLGNEFEGYKYAIGLLNEGRIGIAAQMTGLALGAWENAASYAWNDRKQFGTLIGEFQAMQHQLAQAWTEIQAARALVYNAARKKEAGEDFITDAAMAKLMASQVAGRVSGQAIEWMGGMGFVREGLAEKYFRDSKIGAIYEGTSNIQLTTIGKALQKRATITNLINQAYDPSSIAANNLSDILLRLQAAKEIAEYEKDALRAALHVHQKPRNRHEPPLDLQQRKAFHSGAVWWSPCKLREARFRQLVKEKEKEKELLDKIELKEAKENNRIYQLKIKEAARAAREEAKKVRDEAKAVKAAELDAKRRDRDAAKAIQQPQSGKRKASKPAAKQQPKKRRVGGAGGGTLAEVAAPAPPPTTTRRGRAVNTPAKYR
ncbi:C-terminal domain containing protein [Pyrenophora tritici-repentis]|nr:C-terminal domain containing protein [Pyrenophora tritici-repentis]